MLDSRGVVLPSSSFELQGLPIWHPASLSPPILAHHIAKSSLRTLPSIDFILHLHNCFTWSSPLLLPSPPSFPTAKSVHVYSASLLFYHSYLARQYTRRKSFLMASFAARVTRVPTLRTTPDNNQPTFSPTSPASASKVSHPSSILIFIYVLYPDRRVHMCTAQPAKFSEKWRYWEKSVAHVAVLQAWRGEGIRRKRILLRAGSGS
jgi:hypothetical protein